MFLISPALSGRFFTTGATPAAPMPELLIVIKIMIIIMGEILTVCVTLCDSMYCRGSQSFTNSQRLLKLMSIPSCPLSLSPPAFNLSQPQGVFQKLV